MPWHPYLDLWHVKAASYQVKVFACLTEEEALHAILFGFVHDMVESGVPTSANDTTRLKVHTSKHRETPPKKVKSTWSTPDFGIFLKALKNIHSNVQIERIFGRLQGKWSE